MVLPLRLRRLPRAPSELHLPTIVWYPKFDYLIFLFVVFICVGSCGGAFFGTEIPPSEVPSPSPICVGGGGGALFGTEIGCETCGTGESAEGGAGGGFGGAGGGCSIKTCGAGGGGAGGPGIVVAGGGAGRDCGAGAHVFLEASNLNCLVDCFFLK